MKPRAVVVAHRAAMVAEGFAAALERFPGIAVIGCCTNAADAERLGARADALAIDRFLEGAELVTARLRRKGIRVVTIGEPSEDADDVRISTKEPIASLAAALSPRENHTLEPTRPLTTREEEILQLVGRGFVAKQVARHLGISPKTVEHYKARIYAKLGVPNQAAAVRLVFGPDGLDGRSELRIPSSI